VLAACTFDMRFCYVLSGWEGSAADGQVWDDSRRNDFAISPGTYYLADAGFPTC
jgi:DDE superfamily endonuclease